MHRFTLLNPKDVPGDLPNGIYGLRVIGAHWVTGRIIDIEVLYVPGLEPSECLFKMVKEIGQAELGVKDDAGLCGRHEDGSEGRAA
jgi:hypothetical protein